MLNPRRMRKERLRAAAAPRPDAGGWWFDGAGAPDGSRGRGGRAGGPALSQGSFRRLRGRGFNAEGGRRNRPDGGDVPRRDRKSTRLNSSHSQISYAVFCLKKKTTSMESTDSLWLS